MCGLFVASVWAFFQDLFCCFLLYCTKFRHAFFTTQKFCIDVHTQSVGIMTIYTMMGFSIVCFSFNL
jgi:hypothetical protein